MKAVILGAGRIGRGFVTQLLTLNNVDITYFDASDAMVEQMNQIGHYTIHVLGHSDLDLEVDHVKAYPTSDIDQLAACWKESDFIFTACGGKNMPSVGKTIGQAFKKLVTIGGVHLSNIITCENWIDPAKDLEEAILSCLDEKEAKLFKENVGVGESVILCTGTGAPDPSKVINPIDTWVQNFKYLPIDKDAIKTEIPNWEYIEFVDNFGHLLTQKLYTNNTSCGSVAYLGHLKGLTYMAEAANDVEIEPIMDEIYNEINQALIQGMGIDAESQYAFSKRAKAKYTDRDIVDKLTRIARDPLRKLRPEDRLIGPSNIALSIGVKPTAIALATAAALFYDEPDDESAMKLQQMRKEHGVEYILQNVCQLKPEEELYQMILSSIDELRAKGWLKE
ncbi:mannitol dehydrogenase [Faecalicoccus pleomorphus]|uniref:Mannitol dehydrogenase n=1 Tax=Faecalicoccus pleomorphus TaxID=1323 RepID=A0A3E3DUK6_9FIRM|nr:mannitol dehydrogenase [Faecalicoccus pleomorphus]MDB7989859.1 mannitol dehydrogenase [Faecalicoccus pleomorphus]MDB7994346.1 mannitol dehydrogenase [Faecalicoccus pleomorphus]RGD72766.1 mannitol dehydrogenase [Faecalicoccus pleomorphus]